LVGLFTFASLVSNVVSLTLFRHKQRKIQSEKCIECPAGGQRARHCPAWSGILVICGKVVKHGQDFWMDMVTGKEYG
jgi:hypothetical protein